MSMTARSSGGGGDFTPAPQGTHEAVCVDVVDLGMKDSQKWGEKHKVRIVWQIDSLFEYEKDGVSMENRFIVNKQYTVSMHTKSNLRPDIESWLGEAFADEDALEAEGFDLESLLGKPCFLNIVHEHTIWQQKETTFANVKAIMPSKNPLQVQTAYPYTRVKNREDYEPPQFSPFNEEVSFSAAAIDSMKSAEDRAKTAGDLAAVRQAEEATEFDAAVIHGKPNPEDDDDIPF